MEGSDTEAALQDLSAHEGLSTPVWFGLRDVADAAKIKLARLPGSGILNGEILRDWRSDRVRAYVIAGSQKARGDPWNQNVAGVRRA
jgi:hypothetical protein